MLGTVFKELWQNTLTFDVNKLVSREGQGTQMNELLKEILIENCNPDNAYEQNLSLVMNARLNKHFLTAGEPF